MKILYLEDEGLRLSSKKNDLSTPVEKKPPKLHRNSKQKYDSSFDEETPTFLISSSNERSFRSCSENRSLSGSSYFLQFFTILNILGEGCFGKVYKTRSHIDQKLYAVKENKSPVRNNSHRQFKLEEVKRHEEISHHPNIVRLHDAWEERRIIYIQLELCEMSLQTLSTQIKEIPEQQIWDVLVDILWALQYIHGLNYVHLDVKLDNILVGFDGRYKLSDFGLVYNMTKKIGYDPLEGDSKYLAPEILNHKYTTAADIFSLGISILELAANVSLPSQGVLWRELRENVLPRTQTANLSKNLISIIAVMMTSNYKVRPSADDLLTNIIILSKIKFRNRVLTYHDMKNKLRRLLHLVSFNLLRIFASVWSLFPNSKSILNRTLEVPTIKIHPIDTESPKSLKESEPQNTEIFYTPQLSIATKNARNIRQQSKSSVKRNLFSSFSSSSSSSEENH